MVGDAEANSSGMGCREMDDFLVAEGFGEAGSCKVFLLTAGGGNIFGSACPARSIFLRMINVVLVLILNIIMSLGRSRQEDEGVGNGQLPLDRFSK